MTTAVTAADTDLERKIDALAAQVAELSSELREQRLRRMQWDELREDLMPLAGQAMAMASKELEEVQEFVQPEDFLRLLKRLARNTRRIEEALGRFESTMELIDDISPLATDAVGMLTTTLDGFDRRGYFTFARSGLGVVDRIVGGFTEEDVNHLADNVVLILDTVKDMTQPEIMEMLQRTAGALEEEVAVPSLRELLRQMRDPAVKRGIARFMRVMQSVAEPQAESIGRAAAPTKTPHDN